MVLVRVALEGPHDHDQVEGETEEAVEEGQEPSAVVDGGQCEEMPPGANS